MNWRDEIQLVGLVVAVLLLYLLYGLSELKEALFRKKTEKR
jgi:hypothetical protein